MMMSRGEIGWAVKTYQERYGEGAGVCESFCFPICWVAYLHMNAGAEDYQKDRKRKVSGGRRVVERELLILELD